MQLAISFESHFSDHIACDEEYWEEAPEEEDVVEYVYVDELGVEHVCGAEDVYEGEDGNIYLYESDDETDVDDDHVPPTDVAQNTSSDGGDNGPSKKDDSDGGCDQTSKTGSSFNIEDFLA